MKTPAPSRLRSRRGAVLIVSLIFSAVIAISIASFLRLATTASQISYRTYYLGVAMNIAETGLERALWSINKDASGGADAWSEWEAVPNTTNAYRQTIDLGVVEGGATAVVKVYARERTGASMPNVIARAIVTPKRGGAIEKWVRVTLDRRGRVAVGGLGRDGIVASGNNVYFASWNSDPDNDPSTPYVPFSEAVKNDGMTLATLELDAELNSGQADVNGSAAVGSNSLDAIKVGAQGYIGPFGTPVNTIDPGSVSTDFTADLEVEPAPSGVTYKSLGSVTTDLTLPRPEDVAEGGVYYYEADQINLNGKVLSIDPGYEVVIHIPTQLTAINIGGNDGAIRIKGSKDPVSGTLTTSTLKIYTPGDIKIAGKGSANEVSWTETTTTIVDVPSRIKVNNRWVNIITPTPVTATDTITQVGQPKSLQIYGTLTNEQAAVSGNQSINVSGNGSLSAVVYAPNGDISAKGGGNAGFMHGSLIGASLTFTGNDSFYYDESLGNLDNDSRFGINTWTELVGYADRTTYASLMNF